MKLALIRRPLEDGMNIMPPAHMRIRTYCMPAPFGHENKVTILASQKLCSEDRRCSSNKPILPEPHQPVFGTMQPIHKLGDDLVHIVAGSVATHSHFQGCDTDVINLRFKGVKRRRTLHLLSQGAHSIKNAVHQAGTQERRSLLTCFSFGTTWNLDVVALIIAMSTFCKCTHI